MYTVKNWVRYLIQEGKLYLSSIKPTKDMGNNFKNKPELLRRDITEKTITNEIPPPVGVGFTCELLELGLSIKYFLRNFIR